MTHPILLIVEDNDGFRESLMLEFSERGYETYAAGNLKEVEAILAKHQPELAVVDLKLGRSNGDGLRVIEATLEVAPHARVVVMTGYASLATAVEAIKLGAIDYLAKPVSIDRLERALWAEARGESDEQRETLARHEREYIEYVIQQCGGNITRAAKWLGIHRQSLQRKLRKYTPR